MLNKVDLENFKSVTEIKSKSDDLEITTICTDSRSYNKESLFIAIDGEKFDAMDFCDQIYEAGCRRIACKDSDKNRKQCSEYSDLEVVYVNNAVKFIQETGQAYSHKLQTDLGGKTICISGSNGKTTTKEMLFYILSSLYPERVICTQKNNNNHLGVPFTLFQINKKTKFAIVELGSNHPGEIQTVAEIAAPKIGVTTNIGATHLEFFDGLEGVFQEEGFLYYEIEKQGGTFFLNGSDEYLKKLPTTKWTITYGEIDRLDFSLDFSKDQRTFCYKEKLYTLKNHNLIGDHNFINLSLAIAISQFVTDIDLNEIMSIAETFVPSLNRSQIIKRENKTIYLDAYNANPTSMKASIEGFLAMTKNSTDKSLFIIGDMNELGSDSDQYHVSLGEFLKEKEVTNVVFVGRFADLYSKGFGGGECFSNINELKEVYPSIFTFKEESLFLKASRSVALEKILD